MICPLRFHYSFTVVFFAIPFFWIYFKRRNRYKIIAADTTPVLSYSKCHVNDKTNRSNNLRYDKVHEELIESREIVDCTLELHADETLSKTVTVSRSNYETYAIEADELCEILAKVRKMHVCHSQSHSMVTQNMGGDSDCSAIGQILANVSAQLERLVDICRVDSSNIVSDMLPSISCVGSTDWLLSDVSCSLMSPHSVSEAETYNSCDSTYHSVCSSTLSDESVYQRALYVHRGRGIACRQVHTHLFGLSSDVDYLCKVQCLRQGFTHILGDRNYRSWLCDISRRILHDIMTRLEEVQANQTDMCMAAFDSLLSYVMDADCGTLDTIMCELRARGVCQLSFYDIVIDYILLDSFTQLDRPPSHVTTILTNQWIPLKLKRIGFISTIQVILNEKRRRLSNSDGFRARFYTMCETLTPALLWSLFVCMDSSRAHTVASQLKCLVLAMVSDMFSDDFLAYHLSGDHFAASLREFTSSRFRALFEFIQQQ